MKILMLKGLPASGKSTFALNLIKEDDSYIRVNKDDIRKMIYGKTVPNKGEQNVEAIRDHIIRESLDRGFNIVVDDTNLANRHINRTKNIAAKFGAEVEVKLFDTPYEECLRRNALRENPIPEKVIKEMNNKFFNNETIYKNKVGSEIGRRLQFSTKYIFQKYKDYINDAWLDKCSEKEAIDLVMYAIKRNYPQDWKAGA